MRTIKKRLASLASLVRPLMLTFVGIVLLSLSVTSLFIWAYRGIRMPDIFYYLMLQFMPGPTRGILLLVFGISILIFGIWDLSGIVVIRLREDAEANDMVVLGYRRAKRPHIVVLSGGPGMLMLSCLGEHVERLTCIPPVQDHVEYYYRASSLFHTENVYYVVPTPVPIKVHAQLNNGMRMNVMHVNPKFNPNPNIAECHVQQIWLQPDEEKTAQNGGAVNNASLSAAQMSFPVTRLARESIQNADAIILGPGSLFESVIPNLLLDDVRTAIQQSKARKIYICNLMTEPGLTTGFSVGDHIQQIKHYGGFIPDYVLVNIQRIDSEVLQMYEAGYQSPVYLAPEEYDETNIVNQQGISQRRVIVEESAVIESDLASSVIQYSASLDNPNERRAVRVLRHDPQKLTSAILELLRQE